MNTYRIQYKYNWWPRFHEIKAYCRSSRTYITATPEDATRQFWSEIKSSRDFKGSDVKIIKIWQLVS